MKSMSARLVRRVDVNVVALICGSFLAEHAANCCPVAGRNDCSLVCYKNHITKPTGPSRGIQNENSCRQTCIDDPSCKLVQWETGSQNGNCYIYKDWPLTLKTSLSMNAYVKVCSGEHDPFANAKNEETAGDPVPTTILTIPSDSVTESVQTIPADPVTVGVQTVPTDQTTLSLTSPSVEQTTQAALGNFGRIYRKIYNSDGTCGFFTFLRTGVIPTSSLIQKVTSTQSQCAFACSKMQRCHKFLARQNTRTCELHGN